MPSVFTHLEYIQKHTHTHRKISGMQKVVTTLIEIQCCQYDTYHTGNKSFFPNNYELVQLVSVFIIKVSLFTEHSIAVLTEIQQHMCQRGYWCLLPKLAPVHPATPSYQEYVCSQPAMIDGKTHLSHWKLFWINGSSFKFKIGIAGSKIFLHICK